MRFRAFRVDWDTFFFDNFRELRATREARNGSKGVIFFYCIFTLFRAFWVDRDTLFFRKFSWAQSAKRAKPEGVKRPSSPAGLAGRSAERACKLVAKKENICCQIYTPVFLQIKNVVLLLTIVTGAVLFTGNPFENGLVFTGVFTAFLSNIVLG